MNLEEEQNWPSQNMPLWHKDYPQLVILKKESTQEKLKNI